MAQFIGGGMGGRQPAVVIATEPHRVELERRLSARGLDVDAARRAASTSRSMPPDAVAHRGRRRTRARRFEDVVGGVLARASLGSAGRCARSAKW
jgi:hypothetical protein